MHNIRSFKKIDETKSAYSTDSINLLFYRLPKNFSDDYKSYDCPRLCTIIEGAKEVSVNHSDSFIYRKDKFIFLPPHSNVHMFMSENTQALVYEFNDDLIYKVSQQVSERLEIDVNGDISYSTFQLAKNTRRINELNQRTQVVVSERDNNMSFLLDLVSQEMVYELMKMKGCCDIIHHHRHHPINRAIRLMNAGHCRAVTISEIAEELNMSLANFSQRFKAITELSPKEYLTKIRMKKARYLLQSLSVTDTAYEIGYDNISHFIKLFKNEFGITPKQYQLKETVTILQ